MGHFVQSGDLKGNIYQKKSFNKIFTHEEDPVVGIMNAINLNRTIPEEAPTVDLIRTEEDKVLGTENFTDKVHSEKEVKVEVEVEATVGILEVIGNHMKMCIS